jgi:hypothetical protein
MRRRRLLALLGGATVPLAGCSSQPSDTPSTPATPTRTPGPPETPSDTRARTPTTTVTPTPDQFSKVVDVVGDLGCDAGGEESCEDTLEAVDGDSVLYRFPSGTYRFDSRLIVEGADRIGFVGNGDVTLRPPPGFNEELFLARVGTVHLANVTVDIRASNTTAGFTFVGDRGLTVENVRFLGRGQHDRSPVVNALALAVRQRSGLGVVRNLVAKQGSAIGHYRAGNGRTGIWAGGRHKGTLRVENCRFDEFGNNAIYASRCPGRVQVVDSVFRNNNVSAVRISGEGSYARNLDIEVDLSKYDGPRTRMDDQFNTRCVIIEQNNFDKPAGAVVEDCSIRVLESPVVQDVVDVGHYGRSLTLRNTEIRIDVDAPAVWRKWPRTPGPTEVVMENVSIGGSAAGRSAIRLEGATGSVLRDVYVDQDQGRRNGVTLLGSNGCLFDGGSISAGRYPVVIDDDEESSACWLLVGRTPELSSTGGTPTEATTVSDLSFDTVRGNACVDTHHLDGTSQEQVDRLALFDIGATELTFVLLQTR